MEDFVKFWWGSVEYITARYAIFALGAFVLFYFLIRRFVQPRKVQQRFPNWKHHARDIMYSAITTTIFATVAAFVMHIWFAYTNMYKDVSEFGWPYLIFTVGWMLFIHDTYFYWMHRAMHHPNLFKAIHLIHHKAHNPTPFTSYAFHPLEAVLEVMIIPIIAFTIPVHQMTFVFFLLFQFIYNVYGHLGFELFPKGFHKTWIGRYINTSVCHNMHHRYSRGNYGLYFTWWDRAMGTLHKKYDQTYETTTTRTYADVKAAEEAKKLKAIENAKEGKAVA